MTEETSSSTALTQVTSSPANMTPPLSEATSPSLSSVSSSLFTNVALLRRRRSLTATVGLTDLAYGAIDETTTTAAPTGIRSSTLWIILSVCLIVLLLITLGAVFLYWRLKRRLYEMEQREGKIAAEYAERKEHWKKVVKRREAMLRAEKRKRKSSKSTVQASTTAQAVQQPSQAKKKVTSPPLAPTVVPVSATPAAPAVPTSTANVKQQQPGEWSVRWIEGVDNFHRTVISRPRPDEYREEEETCDCSSSSCSCSSSSSPTSAYSSSSHYFV